MDVGKTTLPPVVKLTACLFLSWSMASCGGGSSATSADSTPQSPQETVERFTIADAAARDEYAAARVTVSGRVVDDEGNPLTGLSVTFSAVSATTEQDGTFMLAGVVRDNGLLLIEGSGVRSQYLAVSLRGDADASTATLPTVVAVPDDGAQRLLFAGDTSFGRRFLDPGGTADTNEIPPGDPAALILSNDPLPGSRAALSFVRSVFQQADYPVVNFESPILTDPATPHPTKDYVFFSLPGSLPALSEVGVDYVSLGNNHVYDYLAQGLDETLASLDSAGIAYSGAAATPDGAFAPYRVDIANQPYSLISATSVSGSQHDVLYVADDTQGGAADLRDDVRVQRALGMEADAGRFVIAQLHTGQEYVYSPSSYARDRMNESVDAGADLVVAHHPHIAQGVEYRSGVLMYHGLGNFLFDQDRLETMLGLLAQVDVADGSVLRARALPIYLEDYRPRLITGDLANRFLRRISEYSDNAVVISYLSEAWIQPDMTGLGLETTQVTVPVTVPDAGVAIVDLRRIAPSDTSLATVATSSNSLSLRLGRDILIHGDFEDDDVDPDQFESQRWSIQSSASFTCQAWSYDSVQALCLTRSATNASDTVVAFRNRVRVMGDALNAPNKDLSLVAYLRGDNAGPTRIVSRYYPSSGSDDFGEEAAISHPGGTFDWQMLHQDLNMPADLPQFDADPAQNPRALRLFVRHSPMQAGVGMATVDELAVVNWEEMVAPDTMITTPHARDFLRVEAAPGSYELALTFHRYQPLAAQD